MIIAKQMYRVRATLTIVDVNYIAAVDFLDAYRQEEELLRLSEGDLTANAIDNSELILENEVVDEWQVIDALNDLSARLAQNITTQQLKDELKHRKRSKE